MRQRSGRFRRPPGWIYTRQATTRSRRPPAEAIPPELVAEAARFLVDGLPVPPRYWPALGMAALRDLSATRSCP